MKTSIKTCFKCKTEKPLAEFYKHKQMADGHLNKCKSCARSDTTRNRTERINYYRDYDKHRAMQPHRVAQRLQYQQTESGKLATSRARTKWLEKNPKKRAASTAVGNAVRDGRLEKPEICEECGSGGRTHGHHDDYSKPLEVRWLCPKCHYGWHKENGEAKNAAA